MERSVSTRHKFVLDSLFALQYGVSIKDLASEAKVARKELGAGLECGLEHAWVTFAQSCIGAFRVFLQQEKSNA
jgi:hypothetical protein